MTLRLIFSFKPQNKRRMALQIQCAVLLIVTVCTLVYFCRAEGPMVTDQVSLFTSSNFNSCDLIVHIWEPCDRTQSWWGYRLGPMSKFFYAYNLADGINFFNGMREGGRSLHIWSELLNLTNANLWYGVPSVVFIPFLTWPVDPISYWKKQLNKQFSLNKFHLWKNIYSVYLKFLPRTWISIFWFVFPRNLWVIEFLSHNDDN